MIEDRHAARRGGSYTFERNDNMNLASIIAIIVLLLMLIPAIRYLYKNGTCGSCPDKGSCSGKCESKKLLHDMMKDPDFKDKSDMIDDIINKHKTCKKTC